MIALISIVIMLLFYFFVDNFYNGAVINFIQDVFGWDFASFILRNQTAFVFITILVVLLLNSLIVEVYSIQKISHVFSQMKILFQKDDQRIVLDESLQELEDDFNELKRESIENEKKAIKEAQHKVDMIAYLAHDIKTPLTSIINYVDLLKREDFEDPKIRNYLQVLEEKAYRLKTLTEDVVEASKVSSGNISLEMMNLNLVELVNQTSAEFEEKFEARNLKMIMNLPTEPATIYADGRRMWRVLANVFNNAAKYAMEGSRVYVDLVQTGEEVQFTIKNVSEQPLNISADELTERFIRGDVSRSTEGSGLGLSIAQNLTKLQGGNFELYLDGDLFKVLIRFPVPKETEDVYQEVEQ